MLFSCSDCRKSLRKECMCYRYMEKPGYFSKCEDSTADLASNAINSTDWERYNRSHHAAIETKQTNIQSHTQISTVLYVYDVRIQRENSSSNQKKRISFVGDKYQTYILKKSTISSADGYPSLAFLTARFFASFWKSFAPNKSLLSPGSIFNNSSKHDWIYFFLRAHQLRTCFLQHKKFL